MDSINIDKKSKKKRDRNQFEEEATVDEIDAVQEERENDRKKKKKEKRDKKKRENETKEAQQQVIELAEEEVVSEGNQEKKKKKKKKKSDDKTSSSTLNGEEPINKSGKFHSTGSVENRYVEHSSTKAMTEEEVLSIREKWAVTVLPPTDAATYNPILNFEYLLPSLKTYCPYVLDYIHQKKFSQPTPIQGQCWPPLLAGRDVIGIAMTGSGKTLAFLIPALLKIAYLDTVPVSDPHNLRRIPSPRVLVLAPTRELAMQSQQVVTEIGGPKGVCIYGGVSKQAQKQELQSGVDIVVATPGRLIDLIEEHSLSMSSKSLRSCNATFIIELSLFCGIFIGVSYLVLDEADRMLDEGFEPAIKKILSLCPASGPTIHDRQTVMFSATWPESIRSLADKYLKHDVIRVTVGSEELSANHRVKQIVECIQMYEKDRKLFGLLEKYHVSRKNRVLIFVLYKKEAVELQNKIMSKGYAVTAIHGDKSQYDRTAALEEFKKGSTPLMIATDVAARGLDIPQVEV